MAFQQKTSWCVLYKDAALSDSFESLRFVDRADGDWSMAWHVSKPMGKQSEGWLDNYSQLIKAGGEIEFKISDTAQSVALPPQKHIVVGSRIRRRKTTMRFEFVTIEKRAIMLASSLMKHYEGEISEIASQVIHESGLTPGVVESTSSPDEFRILHCPGWSAHEFIDRHLVKRAVNQRGEGGYCLFSSNGDEVSFCTPRTVRGNLQPDSDQVVDSIEGSAMLSFAEGGGETTALGFDPEKLEPMTSPGGLAPGEERGRTPLSQAISRELLAGLKQEALKVFASTSNSFASWKRSYVIVNLFGDVNCGVKLPARLTMDQRFYPEAADVVAVVRVHDIKKGLYSCSHFAVPST